MRKTIKVTSVAAATLATAILMGSNTVKADVNNNTQSMEANSSVKETKVNSNADNNLNSANDSSNISTDQKSQTLIVKKKSTKTSDDTEIEKNKDTQKQTNNNRQNTQELINDQYSDSKIRESKKNKLYSNIEAGRTQEDNGKAHLIHKDSQQEVDKKIHEKYEKVINDGSASESDWQDGLPQDSDLESIKDKDGVTIHIGDVDDDYIAVHPLENNTITYDGKENTYTAANAKSSFLGFINSDNQSKDMHTEDSVHTLSYYGSKWKKIDNNILIKRTVKYKDSYNENGMEVIPFKYEDGTVGYRTSGDGHSNGSEQTTTYDLNINEYVVITPEGNIVHTFKVDSNANDYYTGEPVNGLLGFYSKIDTSLNRKDGVKLFSTGKNGVFLTDGKLVYGIRGLNGSKVSAIDFNTNNENKDIDNQKYQSVLPEGADTEIKVSKIDSSATSSPQFDLWYIETAYRLKNNVAQSVAQIADGLNSKFDSEVQTNAGKQTEDQNKESKHDEGTKTNDSDKKKSNGGTKVSNNHDNTNNLNDLWSDSQVEHNLRDVKNYAHEGLMTLEKTFMDKLVDLKEKELSFEKWETFADLFIGAAKKVTTVPLYAYLNSHNQIKFSHKKPKGKCKDLSDSAIDTLYVYKKKTKSKKFKIEVSKKYRKNAYAIDKGMLYVQMDKKLPSEKIEHLKGLIDLLPVANKFKELVNLLPVSKKIKEAIIEKIEKIVEVEDTVEIEKMNFHIPIGKATSKEIYTSESIIQMGDLYKIMKKIVDKKKVKDTAEKEIESLDQMIKDGYEAAAHVGDEQLKPSLRKWYEDLCANVENKQLKELLYKINNVADELNPLGK